jgi:hypothetical protein
MTNPATEKAARELTLQIKRCRQATRFAHSGSDLAGLTEQAKDAHGMAAERWYQLRNHPMLGHAAAQLSKHHQTLSFGLESEIPVKGLTYDD